MKLSNEEKQAVFAVAVQRLRLRPGDSEKVFGVSRQTFYRWSTGAARIPDSVFIRLVQHENNSWSALNEREEEIKKLAARLNGGRLDS